MEQKKFSPYEALAYGLRTFIDHLRLFTLTYFLVIGLVIGSLLVAGLINFGFFKAVGSVIYTNVQQPPAEVPAGNVYMELVHLALQYIPMLSLTLLALLLFYSGIIAGYAGLYLQVYDTGSSTPRRVVGFMKKSLTMFLASSMALILILGGILLFIIPGIYIALRLSLALFFIVDRNAGPVQALKLSWKASQGHVWQLAVLGLIQFLLTQLTLIGLFLGFITSMAYTYAYRKLTA